MRPQHRRADAVRVVIVGSRLGIERQQRILPCTPTGNIFGDRRIDALAQAGAHAQGGFLGMSSKAQGHDETAAAGTHIDLTGQRDIAVVRVVVAPAELVMTGEVLPAVRDTDEAGGASQEGSRAADGEGAAAALREEHRHALVVGDPGCIAGAAIDEVGCEQRIEAIVADRARERLKLDPLQQDVAPRIGEHQLFEPVAPVGAGAGDGESRYTVGDRSDDAFGVALLLREEAASIGDDETEIPRAGLVDARIVDLVQNAVAQREPHLTPCRKGRADAALGAGGPPSRNARPSGCRLLEGHGHLSKGSGVTLGARKNKTLDRGRETVLVIGECRRVGKALYFRTRISHRDAKAVPEEHRHIVFHVTDRGDLGDGNGQASCQLVHDDTLIRPGRGYVEIIRLGARDQGPVRDRAAQHRLDDSDRLPQAAIPFLSADGTAGGIADIVIVGLVVTDLQNPDRRLWY